MQFIKFEASYAASVATLLNEYLPFEPETAETVLEAEGVRYICVDGKDVIGYVAGYLIEDVNNEFPYFKEELKDLRAVIEKCSTMYTSHFVVHPGYRKKGIGSKLVGLYMDEAKRQSEKIVVVGWVQSDLGLWAAERQFMQYPFEQVAYIERYFEPYAVECPSCGGLCTCDANIVIR